MIAWLLALFISTAAAQTSPGNCQANTLVGNNGGGLTCLTGTQAGAIIGGAVRSVSNSDGTLTITPTTGNVVAGIALGNANTWTVTQTFPNIIDTGLSSAGTQCVQAGPTGVLSGTGAVCGTGGGGGGVTNVSNIDGTLTVSPSTGAVVASLNLSHANVWTASQTVSGSTFIMPMDKSLWSNNSPPEGTARLGNRTLVGDATRNPDITTLHPCVTSLGDWLTNYQNSQAGYLGGACSYFPFFTMVVETKSINGSNSGAILAAGQTADCSGNCGAFGMATFGVANGTTSDIVWATYDECNVVTAGATCYSLEVEMNNWAGPVTAPDPFNRGFVNNLILGCGGSASGTIFNCQSLMETVAIGGQAYVGINFLDGSLVPNGGPNINLGATTPAIAMPDNYYVLWYSAAHTLNGGIWTGTAGKINIFGANGLNIVTTGAAASGANCSGFPTSSFRTIAGIVITC